MNDPINSLEGWFARMRYGPMHTFTISQKGDHSIAECEQILQRYHVPVWGRFASQDEGGFIVKQKQAAWAKYILCRAGVALLDRSSLARVGGGMPEPWGEAMKPHSVIANIVAVLSPPVPARRQRRKR